MANRKKNEEATEADLDRAYKVGQSSGLEEAATRLMKEASGYFQSGEDEKAGVLRRIAKEMQDAAQKRHPGVPTT